MKISFGKYINIKRKERGLSLRETAEKMKLSPTYLCDLEKNRRYPPSFEYLLIMKRIFNLDHIEWECINNLSAEKTKKCPDDILQLIYSMDEISRFMLWTDVRTLLKNYKSIIDSTNIINSEKKGAI